MVTSVLAHAVRIRHNNGMQSYPRDFLWGASTASHQVEGNNHNQWSEWEKANADRLAKTAEQRLSWLPSWEMFKDQAQNPTNYISGKGVDHYNRYEEDFNILKQLNMNAFRFGIEWSRIEPQEGHWDQAAIEHYRAYIGALKARGIEPILTLWHWTMPTWFTDRGSFETKANIRYFTRYVQKIAEEFAPELHYVITLNEPNVYIGYSYGTGEWPPQQKNPSLAYRVYQNLAYAHNAAYDTLKKEHPHLQVGIAAQLSNAKPVDPKNILNVLSIKLRRYAMNSWFLNRIKRHQDFIGLNYYFTEYCNWRWQIKNPKLPVSDLGWYMEPYSIHDLLQTTYKKYGKPLLITENGLADASDKQREWWITETIRGIDLAQEHGVELLGYLHWSLLDNFEWAYGWWPEFGLVHVDRKTMKRTVRPSAEQFARIIEQKQAS